MTRDFRRFDGLAELPRGALRTPAVTVGVFDGIHRGHQLVLDHLRVHADAHEGEAVVVTFDTHPRRIIEGAAPRQILSTDHRVHLLERLGVDAVLVLPFDEALRTTSYEAFTRDVLVDRLGVRALLFGYDTRFGHEAKGTAETLRPLGAELGFDVHQVPPLTLRGAPISSRRIRDAIEQGELAIAAEMLGRAHALSGVVIRGDGRGRQIGFPTANVDLAGELLPPPGVYQVVAQVGDERYAAVANIGRRPTFADATPIDRPLLEVHIPGFEGDLYDAWLEVELVRKLRDERRFESAEALVQQIRRDVASLGTAPDGA